MLKGVNKQILEITNTESPYFERIIFFVRSSSPETDERKLRVEAEKISSSTAIKPPKTKPSKKQIISTICTTILSAMAGVGVVLIVSGLISR